MKIDRKFPQKEDTLFKADIDWQYNACINYSHNYDHAYTQGYKDIGDLACKNLLEENGTLDTLVLPICFNYRHYIELTLKGIIDMIYFIENNKNQVPSHHRIYELWKICYAGILRLRDDAPKPQLKKLDILIKEFSDLDPKGEEFRYSFVKNKNKTIKRSLDGTKLINIRNLYEVMERIDHLLSCTDLAIGEIYNYCSEQY